MIKIEQACPEENSQKLATGGEFEGIFSHAAPLATQGITGSGFVLIDYRPPEKSSAYHPISIQNKTGDQIS